MTSSNNALQSIQFPPDQRVRLANLLPETTDLSTNFIEAQVVLIWPFSSSTRRFSFLLSETDARPFKSRRQLKVTFHNGSARAAQKTHVGIGDTVRILLNGCEWTKTQDETSTPGKRLEWDAQFRKKVTFEVDRPDTSPFVVQYQSTGTPSPQQTPISNAVHDIVEEINSNSKFAISHLSPAAARQSLHPHVDSPLDPFAEDKEFVFGRSRKRTKFSRPSGAWKLLDGDEEAGPEAETPSKPSVPVPRSDNDLQLAEEVNEDVVAEFVDLTTPVVETFGDDASMLQMTGQKQQTGQTSPPAIAPVPDSNVMAPPEQPARAHRSQQMSIDVDGSESEKDGSQTTPRLVPLASPGLPLVSPLIHRIGVEIGYFPTMPQQPSELDAISRPPTETDRETPISDPKSPTTDTSDESVLLVEPLNGGVSKVHETTISREVLQQDISTDVSGLVMPQPVRNVPVEEQVDSQLSIQKQVSQVSTSAALPNAQTMQIEDEDMYGAPEDVPTRTVLDALEEFLDQSSGADQAIGVLDSVGLGQAGMTVLTHDAPNTANVGVVSTSSVVAEIGSRPAIAEEKPPSPPHSLDGTVDDAGSGVSDQVRLLQGLTKGEMETMPQPDSSMQEMLVVENEDNKLRTQVEDEEHRHQQYPLTPAATQEISQVDDGGIRPLQMQSFGRSILPTPTQSQDNDYRITSTDGATFEQTQQKEEVPSSSTPEVDTAKPQRISQRLTRKSKGSEELSSPYFISRTRKQQQEQRPAQPLEPTSSQPQARESSPLPSSPTRPPRGSPEVEDEGAEASKATEPAKTGLRTDMAYFPPLSSLQEHFGQLVDVIAVYTETFNKTARADKGPRDYYTSLWLADSSLDAKVSSKISAQVFRVDQQALPSAQRGDIVLLRNFKVQSAKRRMMLLSTDASAWAVFKPNSSNRAGFDDVQVAGPPIEYGRGETTIVKKLSQWWNSDGESNFRPSDREKVTNGSQTDGAADKRDAESEAEDASPDLVKAHLSIDIPSKDAESVLNSVEQSTSPRRSQRKKNKTDSTNNEEDQYSAVEDAETFKTPPPTVRKQPPRRARAKTPQVNGTTSPTSPVHRRTRSTTTPTHRVTRSTKSPSVVHELRDGTKYVDDGKRGVVVHELRDGRNYTDK